MVCCPQNDHHGIKLLSDFELQVDDECKGWLNGIEAMIALRGVNNRLTMQEEEYLYRVGVHSGCFLNQSHVLLNLSQPNKKLHPTSPQQIKENGTLQQMKEENYKNIKNGVYIQISVWFFSLQILEVSGYNISKGADFKLFSVLAALSHRISAVE